MKELEQTFVFVLLGHIVLIVTIKICMLTFISKLNAATQFVLVT